jgi:hypothetical protein
MSDNNLIINNKKIIDFYKNNPNINFEQVNLTIIDIFEKLIISNNEINNITSIETQLKSFVNKPLSNILSSLFPSAEIINLQNNNSDNINIIKHDNNEILVNYLYCDGNLTKEVIDTFISNVKENNCCGLLISHDTGIYSKNNFQIDIVDDKIIIYIHRAFEDYDKIKIGIDIINHLQYKLNYFECNENTINKDILEEINKEYKQYSLQKLNILQTIKQFNNKLVKQIEDIKFPTLENYLEITSNNKSITKNNINNFICDKCNIYIAKNKQALSSHKRACKTTKEIKLN